LGRRGEDCDVEGHEAPRTGPLESDFFKYTYSVSTGHPKFVFGVVVVPFILLSDFSLHCRTRSQVKSRGTYLLDLEKKGVDIFSELEDRIMEQSPSPAPSSSATTLPFSVSESIEHEGSRYKVDFAAIPVVHCENDEENKAIFLGLTPTSNSKQLEQLRQRSSMSAVNYFIQTPESADKISAADQQVAKGLILLQKGG